MSYRTLLSLAVVLSACTSRPPVTAPTPQTLTLPAVLPLPVSVELDPSSRFVIDTLTRIHIDADASSSLVDVAAYLRSILSPFVRSEAVRGVPDPAGNRVIRLAIDTTRNGIGSEGYERLIEPSRVSIFARTPAGVFHGVQTLRQLLPVSVEHPAAFARRLSAPVGRIVDTPRFEWRGMMLDVSRHFLPPRDIKRFIDLIALYKINRLHLHLADDQGWRIEIKSRPRLTAIGGSTQVGGGMGGFYTQAEYRSQ